MGTLPDNAVLRHKNGKWYAVVMTVEKCKLGLEGKDWFFRCRCTQTLSEISKR